MVESRVVGLFELHGWNVTAGAVEASVVAPVGRGELDVGDGAVRAVVEDGGAEALAAGHSKKSSVVQAAPQVDHLKGFGFPEVTVYAPESTVTNST